MSIVTYYYLKCDYCDKVYNGNIKSERATAFRSCDDMTSSAQDDGWRFIRDTNDDVMCEECINLGRNFD